MRGLRSFARPPRFLGRTAIAVVLVMVGMAYGYASRRGDTAGQRLVRALLAERFTTGRLTGQAAWQPCAARDTAALVPRMRCGGPPDQEHRRSRRIAELNRAVRAAARADSSAATLRADALLDLRFADTATAPAERAAAALEAAHRLAPDDAGVLNELAVAYLAVGERTQELTPMLRALDAVERAAEGDSLRPEILFNRALIHQRLYLVASAGRAWARYLAVERDPAWRREAQAHARWVAQVPDTVAWDGLLASPPARMDSAARAQIAARVRRSPQKAREFGFPLLGAWGEAVQAGDSLRAARLLAVAREIGAAEHALGVDESVRLAVEAIDAAEGEHGVVRQLAAGHLALHEGWRAYTRSNYPQARQALNTAEFVLRSAGSPAAGWATFYLAATRVNNQDYAGGDSLFSLIIPAAGPAEPALAGKAILALGLSQLRRGNYDAAVGHYHDAAPRVVRSRETENEGSVEVLLAEGLALAGLPAPGSEFAFRALRHLSPFRDSRFLNNHLAIVGHYARHEGLPYAALALTDELLQVSRTIGKPSTLTLTLFARVRELMGVNRPDAAAVALGEALQWTDSLPPGRNSERIRARARLILGQLIRSRDPAAALPILAEAVRAYSSFGSDFYLPSALYEGALAARAVGDSAQARRWLLQGVDHLERQKSTFEGTESRAAFYETVENVFDAIIGLELDADRPAEAFAMLERSRVQAWIRDGGEEAAAGRGAPPAPDAVARSLPVGTLFVEYALLPDRLAIWTASRGVARHHAVAIPRDSVAALVERFRGGMGTTRPTEAGVQLAELLVGPIATDLRGVRRLTVVPDRELYRVPFAALQDRASGRYLLQDHEIRTLPSAGFWAAAAARSAQPRRGGGALVVGDPRLNPADAGALSPLPGAAREARQVASLYPGRSLLSGTDARLGEVLRLLPGRSVFHFAGHAVFNAHQPELSYLALAPDSAGQTGLLRAQDIGRLDLSRVDVVVLSACSSLTPRASRTGAVAGLAYSFLRAGAPASVSTLWDVDDGSPTDLLVDFHRRLAAGSPPAEALCQAQLQALASPRPELRAPQAWAAFIYTGP